MSNRDLEVVVREWVHGWALSRNTPAPVGEPDGYRIDVGLPGHRVRYVLPNTSTVDDRCAALTSPGTWLKVCGAPESVPRRWTVGEPEYLMSKDLAGAVNVAVPGPYHVEVLGEGAVRDVLVRSGNGERAARGRVAVWGTAAVVDQVVTEPAHRRRGLGRVVMGELGVLAAELGALRAVLVATEDGLGLYGALGWVVRSPVTAAHLPEP
ncbi:GNAT family N-acetyltransferase [Allokutzneria oryzae]|uniref:GNAT family N-acetyltransferase n=1 Tax=Allokutzneria oryzae TaxID=1378989 RepID=A0ABV6A8I7_9PSEU